MMSRLLRRVAGRISDERREVLSKSLVSVYSISNCASGREVAGKPTIFAF